AEDLEPTATCAQSSLDPVRRDPWCRMELEPERASLERGRFDPSKPLEPRQNLRVSRRDPDGPRIAGFGRVMEQGHSRRVGPAAGQGFEHLEDQPATWHAVAAPLVEITDDATHGRSFAFVLGSLPCTRKEVFPRGSILVARAARVANNCCPWPISACAAVVI